MPCRSSTRRHGMSRLAMLSRASRLRAYEPVSAWPRQSSRFGTASPQALTGSHRAYTLEDGYVVELQGIIPVSHVVQPKGWRDRGTGGEGMTRGDGSTMRR